MKKYFYIAVLVVCLSIMAGNVNAQSAVSSMPEKPKIENPGPAPVAVSAPAAMPKEEPKAKYTLEDLPPVDPKYYAIPSPPQQSPMPAKAADAKNEPY